MDNLSLDRRQQVWQKHQRVYHYTDDAGLKGLLVGQMLHATHFRNLNDGTELQLSLDLLANLITDESRLRASIARVRNRRASLRMTIKRMGGMQEFLTYISQKAIDAVHRPLGEEHFLSCFTYTDDEYEKRNGTLVMWRAYGSGEGGRYALEMDTKAIWGLLCEESKTYDLGNLTFAPAIYSNYVESLIDEMPSYGDAFMDFCIEMVVNTLDKTPVPDASEGFLLFLLNAFSRFKHRGFMDEKEVRLLISPMRMNKAFANHVCESLEAKEVKQKGRGRKYIELFQPEEHRLPITKIIVGPHWDQEGNVQVAKSLARESGYDIPVEISDIPFIDKPLI